MVSVPDYTDPVCAYDCLAPEFACLACHHRAYFDTIDRLITVQIPPGSHSLLDVGAGDGTRASRIAEFAGCPELVLLEPSAAMRARAPKHAKVLDMRAEDLARVDAQFDAITCLWNVLGHIFPAAARAEVLRQFARLLSPQGVAFVDVSHRYNAQHYGVLPTAGRFLRDRLAPNQRNGDVTVTWKVAGVPCTTPGHVFTHAEFAALCRVAGLDIARRYVVDYATGVPRRWSFQGHLLYVLRRQSHTSSI